ncbi:MAG: hypothetical protein H6Q27_240, partial [Ignavibacteriaceae bacterium]|nr:hypothetical protein [Ignavibacteriaceae bacterium]
MPGEILARSANLPDCKELQKMIHQLSAFYQVAPEDFNLSPQALQDLR